MDLVKFLLEAGADVNIKGTYIQINFYIRGNYMFISIICAGGVVA